MSRFTLPPAANCAAKRYFDVIHQNMRARYEGEKWRQQGKRMISDDEWEQLEKLYKELNEWRERVQKDSSTWLGSLRALPDIRRLAKRSKTYVTDVRRSYDKLILQNDDKERNILDDDHCERHGAVESALVDRYKEEEINTLIVDMPDECIQLSYTILDKSAGLVFGEGASSILGTELQALLTWPKLTEVILQLPKLLLTMPERTAEDTLLRMKCAKAVRKVVKVTGVIPLSLLVKSPVSKASLPVSRGGFGLVFTGTLEDGRTVAVKVLHFDSATCPEERDKKLTQLYREAIIWWHLRHRNIHRLLGVCLDQLERIADALCYLHESYDPPLVHKDIKGENILVDDEGEPCLTDFGISTYFQSFTISGENGNTGTIAYMAPEILTLRSRLCDNEDEMNQQIRTAITPAYDINAFACLYTLRRNCGKG
ncbi:kinase-like protein [Gloeophyllum trabeum ATCC 11539]|uniref:Kinase-like protein n=1 Tax=Gloeophyllum trabeum (strain ATCC 11539 / FP-39264 / Madison 617) TaxID=670483 RepID=S7RG22_GLOTA|nr:kinase-like protein [Gloeophyllum trabeum ATCC 11539]EPQ53170.1 kinase-like protein [Gloeophyllum trabeum ATCC 11539]